MAKNGKTRLTNAEIRERVTDRIIEQLEKGTVPWHKPWAASGLAPMNARYAGSSKPRPYRGINALLLAMSGYGSPYWLTFKQANEMAYKFWLKTKGLKDSPQAYRDFQKDPERGGVRKGEKSTQIVFWKAITVPDPDADDGKKRIPMARFFNVFNVDQCDALGIENPSEEDREEFNPCEEAEAILAGYDDAPPLTHGGDRAFYNPVEDRIQMPERESFNTPEDYYYTVFHEHVHGTGHDSRLNREGVSKSSIIFGDEDYSKEELVAELGAAMLGAHAGLGSERRVANSAAYIKSWLKKLRDDKNMVMQAAAAAQKATDYMVGVEYSYEDSLDNNESENKENPKEAVPA